MPKDTCKSSGSAPATPPPESMNRESRFTIQWCHRVGEGESWAEGRAGQSGVGSFVAFARHTYLLAD